MKGQIILRNLLDSFTLVLGRMLFEVRSFSRSFFKGSKFVYGGRTNGSGRSKFGFRKRTLLEKMTENFSVCVARFVSEFEFDVRFRRFEIFRFDPTLLHTYYGMYMTRLHVIHVCRHAQCTATLVKTLTRSKKFMTAFQIEP